MAWPKGEKPARSYQAWEPKEFLPTHCTQIIQLMESGKSYHTFCSENNLPSYTFFRWLNLYPDFKLAYHIGKIKFDEHMIDLLRQYQVEVKADGTETLNIQIYKELQKHSRQKPDQLESNSLLTPDSPRTMVTVVLEGLQKGLYDTDEAVKLANLIETAQRVNETSELAKRIDEIEIALKGGTAVNEFKEEDETATY